VTCAVSVTCARGKFTLNLNYYKRPVWTTSHFPLMHVTDAATTDAIFTVWQMQEKYGCKGKVYFAIVDLEKAFDRVPREVTGWALTKAGVEE